MKAAVSIPDPVFRRADALARRRRQSRSNLYTLALEEYLLRHEADELTAAMKSALRESARDVGPFVRSVTTRTLRRIEWDE